MAKVRVEGDHWIWQAGTTRGYGRFFDPDGIGGSYAHRWAYEHWVGPIPEGLTVDHICRIPLCVNPAHLRVLTSVDNFLLAPKNTILHNDLCQRGHEMTPENTYVRKDTGQRVCRECTRQRHNNYYANDPDFRRRAIERARRNG
jgi:hypothetical protein